MGGVVGVCEVKHNSKMEDPSTSAGLGAVAEDNDVQINIDIDQGVGKNRFRGDHHYPEKSFSDED